MVLLRELFGVGFFAGEAVRDTTTLTGGMGFGIAFSFVTDSCFFFSFYFLRES